MKPLLFPAFFLFFKTSLDVSDMPDWLVEEMDSAISEAWKVGTEETFLQMLILIMNENVSGKLWIRIL